MSADSAGNDITLVGVPVTGSIAIAFGHDATIPTAQNGAGDNLSLDQAFVKVGLIKEDGGPEWSSEPDGDPIKFWQTGYRVATGKAKVTLKFTPVEINALVRRLTTGQAPDQYGYIAVDEGAPKAEVTVFTEEQYSSGGIRRRVARGVVDAAKLQKSESGAVQGTEVEVEILKHIDFASVKSPTGGHYGEWWLAPEEDSSSSSSSSSGT